MNNRLELLGRKLRRSGTYGAYCAYLEESITEIIKTIDTSEEAIQVFAFVLMEAPADFDFSNDGPFRKARVFLCQQSSEVKALFREECKKLPRGRDDRINSLLGELVTS